VVEDGGRAKTQAAAEKTVDLDSALKRLDYALAADELGTASG